MLALKGFCLIFINELIKWFSVILDTLPILAVYKQSYVSVKPWHIEVNTGYSLQ